MNFINMSVLILTIVILAIIALVAFFLPKNKYSKIGYIIGSISTILMLAVFFKGQIVSTANGAKINKDNTISEYSIFNKDSYETKEKLFGKVSVKKQKVKQVTINNRVKIVRSLTNSNITLYTTSDDTSISNLNIDK